jgi:hypothetical protein
MVLEWMKAFLLAEPAGIQAPLYFYRSRAAAARQHAEGRTLAAYETIRSGLTPTPEEQRDLEQAGAPGSVM